MSVRQDLSVKVTKAVRDAKIEVIGKDDIANESHAETVLALLKAYGDSPEGFLYIEPYLAKRAVRPEDVLLCHPEVGVLVVEVKGHRIGDIERVSAGHLLVRQNGFVRQKNAFKQAQDAMFDIKNAVERKLGQCRHLPLFEFAVALPAITEQEWRERGFSECLERKRLLLKDDLADRARLRRQIATLVSQGVKERGLIMPLQKGHAGLIKTVFGDSAVLDGCRTSEEAVPPETLGAFIEEWETMEKNLSREQQELSRVAMNGSPRLIRGVAGSGKTVVLANMAARHLVRSVRQPGLFGLDRPPRIAIVCFNTVLVHFLREKFDTALKAMEVEDGRIKDSIRILHLNGLISSLREQDHAPVDYLPIREWPDANERAKAYREQLREFREKQPEWFDFLQFDAIFVDEGQDFEPEEYLLLMDLLKTDPQTGEKNLCIFYDDAQNLYGRTRPTWTDLGIDLAGRRTRVMTECFRNTREIIELSFNVLLGAKTPPGIRTTTRTFADLGDLKSRSLVSERPDGLFDVLFAERRGSHPILRSFSSRSLELKFIAKEIERLIWTEHVRARDILVLANLQQQVNELAESLEPLASCDIVRGIRRVHGRSEDKQEYLVREGYLTVSTIKSAKGYDAPVVFLAGLDQILTDTTGRASFHVGATRAKYVLYLTGVSAPNSLLEEASQVLGALKGEPAAVA